MLGDLARRFTRPGADGSARSRYRARQEAPMRSSLAARVHNRSEGAGEGEGRARHANGPKQAGVNSSVHRRPLDQAETGGLSQV